MKKLKLKIFVFILTVLSLHVQAQLKVTTTGAVSVGSSSTAVSGKLQVYGNAIFSTSTTAPTFAPMIVASSNTVSASTPEYTWFGDVTTGFFHPEPWQIGVAIGGSEKFRFDYHGYLGIGTTSPLGLLSIHSASSDPVNWVTRGDNSPGNSVTLRLGTNNATYKNYSAYVQAVQGSGIDRWALGFGTGSAATATTKMYIDEWGNVGIGTTSPSTRFHTKSAASSDNEIRIDVTSGSNKSILGLSNAGTDYGQLYFDNATNNVVLYHKYSAGDLLLGTNSSTKVTIKNGGNVGIGTTTPGYPLVVGTTTSNGNGAHVTTGGTWTNGSSRQFKQDITVIEGKELLEKIKRLEVARWRYKDTDEYHIGPFAEDFKQIFNVGLEDKYISTIDPAGVALAAIKELIKREQEQEEKIKDLQTQLSYCCTSKQEGNLTAPTEGGLGETNTKPSLLQNNPNPFSKETSIGYYLPTETRSASIMIFDMQGKLVKILAVTNFGNASLTINANELSPGMFIYSLIADGKEVDSKRMILTQ